MSNKKILLSTYVNVNDILDSLNELPPKELAKKVIELGEGGDCTYELHLLKNISVLICKIYNNPKEEEEPFMYKLNPLLKEIVNLLKDEY